jgi:hypothetical protein
MSQTIKSINMTGVQCAGKERTIEFDANSGTLIIYGVSTFEEAQAIISGTGEAHADNNAGEDPPALGLAPETNDPLAETGEFPDDTGEVPEVEVSTEEDTTIYARFTKLKELVSHLHSQGYETFPAVFARCTELINADVCPLLTKVEKLEARIKNTCTLLSIPLENNVA